MRDLNRAVFWLCQGEGEASTVSLLRRALQGKIGFGEPVGNSEDEKKWVRPLYAFQYISVSHLPAVRRRSQDLGSQYVFFEFIPPW
jgi:hypothetical protein